MKWMPGRRLRRAGAALLTLALVAAGCRPATTQPAAPPETPPPATATSLPPSPTGETVLPTQVGDDQLAGSWQGQIDVAGSQLNIKAEFAREGGEWRGTLDIPQQSAIGIRLEAISFSPPAIHFEMLPGPQRATFDGKIATDGGATGPAAGMGIIEGTFAQAGYAGTFSLRKAEQASATPTEVLPYRSEEVTFRNGSVSLAGTLTMPDAGGPFPAVVLISGSGQQTRDEELFGFQPFRLIADYFARNGIAVLRYDDRGIGGSSGDIERATSEDFAGDVASAVAVLKARPEIDKDRIGLLGHSEGGIIAPMVANSDPAVAFVVLLAGPAQTGRQVLQDQVAAIMRSQGAGESDIAAAVAENERLMQVALTGQGRQEFEADVRAKLKAAIEAMPADQREAGGGADQMLEMAFRQQMAAVDSPWLRFFLAYDPAPALRELTTPVLAIFGGRDLQVLAEPNRQAMEEALGSGRNAAHLIKVIPEANHLFQVAPTGNPAEYATLPKEFVPGLLESISEWILAEGGGDQ